MTADQRILIVEDTETERTLISCYLQQQGYRLYHAHDGLDGIHKARLLVPDLILMDTDMPRCSGIDACKVLAQDERTRTVPIIFLSAYATPEQRIQGLLAGAADYIAKPFDFDEVRLRIAVHARPRPASGTTRVAAQDAAATAGHLDELLFHSARVHLLSQLADPPTITELARLAGTNEKRLNAAFRNQTGTTVFGYLREERMKEAHNLLRHTHYPVTDVAEHTGFSSCANFSTAFRARFGVTPSRFRQRQGVHA